MPDWAASLISAVVGFLAAFVPARMQIRHERSTRAQDAASRLLGRIYAVSDAVQFALIAAETSREENGSVENALWLSGELPEEVGHTTPFLPIGARSSATDASANLRVAASRLKSASGTSDQHRAPRLVQARQAYDASQQSLRDLASAITA